jgi:purine nucleosidase
MLLHLDTDFAGDTDDACALAMVLGWPDTEVVGITTTADPDGRRAGYVAHFLELAGRPAIPVAAGAAVSLTTGLPMGGLPDQDRYWHQPVAALPPRPGAALDLLEQSIESGATIVAIGPYTNLALLEQTRPGRLDQVPVVVMGGWVRPPRTGLPQWGPDKDWNVQCDTEAAVMVSGFSRLTMVALPATLGAHLRARDLPRLAASGPIGELLAHQACAHGEEHDMPGLGRAHPALPDDILNFHFDPVACAVALGWQGAEIEAVQIEPVLQGEVLRFRVTGKGPTRLVVDVDGDVFVETWLAAVAFAEHRR